MSNTHEHGCETDHDHEDCDGHDHEDRTIVLQGEDGKDYECHVCGVFPFEGKEYVILQTTGEEPDGSVNPENITTIVMEMIEQEDMATFRSIEDDAEFERVMEFVQTIAQEADEVKELEEVE